MLLDEIDRIEVIRGPGGATWGANAVPEMSGRTMYTRLVETHPESKVLYMSGYDDRAIVRQGVLETGVAFLQKPFSADQMARKVREVLDGSRKESESLKA